MWRPREPPMCLPCATTIARPWLVPAIEVVKKSRGHAREIGFAAQMTDMDFEDVFGSLMPNALDSSLDPLSGPLGPPAPAADQQYCPASAVPVERVNPASACSLWPPNAQIGSDKPASPQVQAVQLIT